MFDLLEFYSYRRSKFQFKQFDLSRMLSLMLD